MFEKKAVTIETYNKSAKALAEKFDTIGPRISDIEGIFTFLHKENPVVLEIGCGNGRDAVEILKRTSNYIGMDVSEKLIMLAQEKNPSGVFIVADIEEYSLPQSIDAIFAFASLIHVGKESFQKILKEALKALNPGGVFRISLKHAAQYREVTNTDIFGTRTYYHYSADDIQECASGYMIKKNDLNYLASQGTTWLEVLLEKPAMA